jgi:hypothetical protein
VWQGKWLNLPALREAVQGVPYTRPFLEVVATDLGGTAARSQHRGFQPLLYQWGTKLALMEPK